MEKICVVCGIKLNGTQHKYCYQCSFTIYRKKVSKASLKKYYDKESVYNSLSQKKKESEGFRFAKDYLKKIESEQRSMNLIDKINERLQKRIIKYNQRTRFEYVPNARRKENVMIPNKRGLG
jgi:hypothetical protein